MNHLSAKAMYSHQMFEFNITPAAIVGPMITLENRNKICLSYTTPKTNYIEHSMCTENSAHFPRSFGPTSSTLVQR